MTDSARIWQARLRLREIALHLDRAQVAMVLGQTELRETALLAAMGAAEAVGRVLGGTYLVVDTFREPVA